MTKTFVALALASALLAGCAGNAMPSATDTAQRSFSMTVAQDLVLEHAYLQMHPQLALQLQAQQQKVGRMLSKIMDCNNAQPASSDRRTPEYTNCPNPPPNPYQNWQMQIESVNTYTMAGFGSFSMSDYSWPSPYRVWPRVASILSCINAGTLAQLIVDGSTLIGALAAFPRLWASIGALPVVQSQMNLWRAGFMGTGALVVAILSEIPVGTILAVLGAAALTLASAYLLIQQMLSIENCLVHGDLHA